MDELPVLVFVYPANEIGIPRPYGGGWDAFADYENHVWWVMGIENTYKNNPGTYILENFMTGKKPAAGLGKVWVDSYHKTDDRRCYVTPVYREQLVVRKMVSLWIGS